MPFFFGKQQPDVDNAMTCNTTQTQKMFNGNSMNTKIILDIPKFGEPIQNQTIAVGREAVFSCVVDNLQTYKVSCPFECLNYFWNTLVI